MKLHMNYPRETNLDREAFLLFYDQFLTFACFSSIILDVFKEKSKRYTRNKKNDLNKIKTYEYLNDEVNLNKQAKSVEDNCN